MPLKVSKTPDNHSKTSFLPLPVTRGNLITAEARAHKPRLQVSRTNTPLTVVFPGMGLVHAAQNFEVAARLLKSLCNSVMTQRSTSNKTVHNRISILSNTLF